MQVRKLPQQDDFFQNTYTGPSRSEIERHRKRLKISNTILIVSGILQVLVLIRAVVALLIHYKVIE